MKTSETLTKIAPALVAAQSEWPLIPENVHVNAGAKKYSFADLRQIFKHIDPVLYKNGLAVLQTPSSDGGQAILITRIMHTSGEWIEDSAPMGKLPDSPQAYGSLLTYWRRYCLLAVLRIASADDDGVRAEKAVVDQRRASTPKVSVAPKSHTTVPEQRMTQSQITILWNQIKAELKKDDAGSLEFVQRVTGKKSMADLMQSDLGRVAMGIKTEKARPAPKVMPSHHEEDVPPFNVPPTWDEGIVP